MTPSRQRAPAGPALGFGHGFGHTLASRPGPGRPQMLCLKSVPVLRPRPAEPTPRLHRAGALGPLTLVSGPSSRCRLAAASPSWRPQDSRLPRSGKNTAEGFHAVAPLCVNNAGGVFGSETDCPVQVCDPPFQATVGAALLSGGEPRAGPSLVLPGLCGARPRCTDSGSDSVGMLVRGRSSPSAQQRIGNVSFCHRYVWRT